MHNLPRLIAISGLSGSGKSSAARALEDAGFFVIDNLPVFLLRPMFDWFCQRRKKELRLGIVVDARDVEFPSKFEAIWREIKTKEPSSLLVFLKADTKTLSKRFSETRRLHPLDTGRGLLATIAHEKELLAPIEVLSDHSLSTDGLNVHGLKEYVSEHFLADRSRNMRITLMSFGFKYGLPPEADLVFDARFLPNPYFHPSLKEKNGLQRAVSLFVLKAEGTEEYLRSVLDFAQKFFPFYEKEGKAYLTLAIGCTGGYHRSPALVEELAKRLKKVRLKIRVVHRELGKE